MKNIVDTITNNDKNTFEGFFDNVNANPFKALNDAIHKLDELKADVITLRDNGYPFNAIIEKTMDDIDSRHRVIAKLASKFRK